MSLIIANLVMGVLSKPDHLPQVGAYPSFPKYVYHHLNDFSKSSDSKSSPTYDRTYSFRYAVKRMSHPLVLSPYGIQIFVH